MSEPTLFRILLTMAFLFQALIDVGGYLGWYYNQFPQEIFNSVGYEALFPFAVRFPMYLLWMAIYYISIFSMLVNSKVAVSSLVLCLALSFINSFVGGVWVATPHELLLSWISWASYIASCVMFLYMSQKEKHG